MGSVYARGRKLWLRFKGPDGKWRGSSTDFVVGQEQLARAALEKLEAAISQGKKPTEVGPLTVARYYAEWLETRKLDVQTWANDEFVFRLHVLPTLGKMKLTEVRPSHLVQLVRGWRSKMSGKSVHNAYSSVCAFFREAALADLIPATPCILKKRHLGTKEPKDPEFRSRAVYGRAELEQLVSDDRISMDRRVLYALEGIGGLRHGEAAGLHWRNCATPTEQLPMIFVAYSYRRPYPKGGKCRPVPVHPTLAAILAEWKLYGWEKMFGRPPGPDDLVVPLPPDARSKHKPYRSKGYSFDRLEEDLVALGLRHRRGHDLRRTMISLMRSDGARYDILRRATHKPPTEVIEGYTFFEWEVVCAELAKLKLARRGIAEVAVLPVAVGSGTIDSGPTDSSLVPGENTQRTGARSVLATVVATVGSNHAEPQVGTIWPSPDSNRVGEAPFASVQRPLRQNRSKTQGLAEGGSPSDSVQVDLDCSNVAKLRSALVRVAKLARSLGADPADPAIAEAERLTKGGGQ